MKRLILTILSIIVLFVVSFFFWGSRGVYPDNEEVKIIPYPGNPADFHDTLTVMTYNIGYLSGMTNNRSVKVKKSLFEKNLQETKALIREINPHLIGFQEIDFASRRSFDINQMDSLAVAGGFKYGGTAVNWDKRYVPFPYWPPSVHFGKILSGQAVISKYPVVENERIILEGPENLPFYSKAFYIDRLVQICRIQLPTTDLIILNVHLEAFDRPTREKQVTEVVRIYQKYSSEYPVILLGDFNAQAPFAGDIDEPSIQDVLNAPGIASAISEGNFDPELHSTFSSREPTRMIDFIFFDSTRIELIDAWVPASNDEASDHLPVIMKCIIRNPG